MSFWFIIGIIIIVWVVYDIMSGTVWIHRPVSYATEPFLFWFCITVYLALGISCLFG